MRMSSIHVGSGTIISPTTRMTSAARAMSARLPKLVAARDAAEPEKRRATAGGYTASLRDGVCRRDEPRTYPASERPCERYRVTHANTMPTTRDRHPRLNALGRGGRSPQAARARGYGLTDLGRKRRSNEDAFFLDDRLGLYIVADGMGGHAAGEVASHEAVDTLYGMVKRGVGDLARAGRPARRRRRARRVPPDGERGAGGDVLGLFDRRDRPRQERDGHDDQRAARSWATTPSPLRSATAASTASRATRRAAHRGSHAHRLAAQARPHHRRRRPKRSPHRNVITRAVGNREYVQVDTRCDPARLGRPLPPLQRRAARIPERRRHRPPSWPSGGAEAVQQFIDLANERGGKDNITAILVEID